MKKKFFTICAAATFLISSCSPPTPSNYDVIPRPISIELKEGTSCIVSDVINICYTPDNQLMKSNAKMLECYLSEQLDIAVSQSADKTITLSLAEGFPEEGYHINVNKDGVLIEASTESGIFYGIQTLRKSLPIGKVGKVELPCVEVSDAPRFSYRGAHLDICRHFLNAEEIKTYIDILALHNMNRLHLHLTDDQGWRIEIKKYPELVTIGSKRAGTVIGKNTDEYDGIPYGGYLTQEEVKDIIAYASEHYITVIPEIDLPGHMQAALAAYPDLGCTGGPYEVWQRWGVSEDVMCIGKPSTLEFLDNVLKEVAELFPSTYFHVGGDECPKVRWKTCPRCQAFAAKNGLKGDKNHTTEEYIQSYVIKHAETYLSQFGKKIIGWDETLEGGLAPEATVMSWRGEAGGIEAAKQNHDVIMTPNTYLYFDYYQSRDIENEPLAMGGYLPVEHVYNYEPMPSSLTAEEQKHIIGVQANVWTEYIIDLNHVEYMTLPRFAALCEVQWTRPELKDYGDFEKRLPQLIGHYDLNGYNYAKHVFEVHSDYTANIENGTLDVVYTTIDDSPIYYTIDGSEPTEQSARYQDPLHINENVTLKTTTIRNGKKERVESEVISFNKASLKPMSLNAPVDERFITKGVQILGDGLHSKNNNYKNGRWLAVGNNNLDVTIDMVEATEIRHADISTCIYKGDWVFDARSFSVLSSDDGVTFEPVSEETYPSSTKEEPDGIMKHELDFEPVTARYFRIVVAPEKTMPKWHYAAGNPASLFVDEIVLY